MKTKQELTEIKELLKKEHKKVYEVEVPMDDEDESKTATIFLKKPDNTTRSIIAKLIDKDPLRTVEAALKNLYIGGDDINAVLAYQDALPSIGEVITELLSVRQAVLKKN